MPSPDLSIALIARDEEKNLPGLFESLSRIRKELSVQIVLVDTGSTDGTVDYAEKQGAEVHHFTWCDDFALARNHGLERCRGNWVLWLDADDVVPEETSEWLAGQFAGLDTARVYVFTIVSPHQDGTCSSFSQIRLFPGGRKIKFSGPIHESLAPSIKECGLTGINTEKTIQHTGYENEEVLALKTRRNRQALEALVQSGKAPVSALFSLARTCQVEGRYREALDFLQRIIENKEYAGQQSDVFLASHIYYGQTLAFMEEFQTAREFFSKHLSMGVTHPQYLFEFGKLLYVTGEKEEAEDMFRKTLQHPPLEWTVPTDWDSIFSGARKLLAEIESSGEKQEENQNEGIDDAGSNGHADIQKLISICTIVKNEEKNIEELCGQLPLDHMEWVVVDTGSTDGTRPVLENHGVKVHQFAWQGDFSKARNFSLGLVTRPLVMWLDADDRLEENFWPSLAPYIESVSNPESSPRAFRFIVESSRDTGAREVFRQIRLFPNHLGIEFEGRIHEQLGTSLARKKIPVEDTGVIIRHLGYFTSQGRMEKQERNFKMLQEEIKEHPDDPVVVMEYGNSLYQQSRYHEAIQVYLDMLKKKGGAGNKVPADETLRSYPVLIADAYDKLGDEEAAESWFDIAGKWDPDNLLPLYWKAKKALGINNRKKAMSHFRAIVGKPVHISKIASDNFTIRRNALGFLVLLELQLKPVPHSSIKENLKELIKDGLDQFPIDLKLPMEYFTNRGMVDELEEYYAKYLLLHPFEIELWENYLEILVEKQNWSQIQTVYEDNPQIQMKSGVLEAFLGKSYEQVSGPADGKENNAYAVYLNGLRAFSEDPTLLVYFTDWVNKRGNYEEAFRDLKSIPEPSRELEKIIGQLKKRVSGGGAVG
ncbi:glycosyltransferase [Fibrobacterota bacterium]